MPVRNIKSFVLGGHGDSMVAMLGATEIDGKNIMELVKEGKIKKNLTKLLIEQKKEELRLLSI